jgi:putative membrane protein
MLLHFIVSWLISALALWIVAQMLPGIQVRDFGSAIVAAAAIAIVNVTIGWILKVIFFPLTFLTLGLFLLVINAFLLKLASVFTPGFRVHGFIAAVVGSLILTILTSVLRRVVFS